MVANILGGSIAANDGAVPASMTRFSEAYLQRRFSGPAYKMAEVAYEITQDVGLLHQYQLLRGSMFIKGESRPVAANNNVNGDVLVARRSNHCVGGVQLTFCEPGEARKLPLEREGCNLSTLFPQLPLSSVRIVEVSGLAVLPDLHEDMVTREMCRELMKHAVARKAAFMVALVPAQQARALGKTAREFGLEWDALGHVELPETSDYEGTRKILCLLDLNPVYRKSNEKQAVAQDLVLSI